MLLLKEITFSYDSAANQKKPLFDRLNLEVKKGSFFVLVGPLGSGKSTLVRLLLGLVKFQGGEYWFNGEKFTDKHRRYISAVFENVEEHFIGLSIEEDLSFSPRFLGFSEEETKKIVQRSMEQVRLKKPLTTLVDSLSAGEKQRLALAGALTKKPLLLVSDESTAYLDPQLRKRINQLFLKLKNRGVTIVHTTHLLEEALLSTEFGVLNKGKIKVFKPTELVTNPDYFSRLGLSVPNWFFKARDLIAQKQASLLSRHDFLELQCSIS